MLSPDHVPSAPLNANGGAFFTPTTSSELGSEATAVPCANTGPGSDSASHRTTQQTIRTTIPSPAIGFRSELQTPTPYTIW